MPVPLAPLRRTEIEIIVSILARGDCCAIFGLSNTGKSQLLRTLPTPEHLTQYEQGAGRPGALIYIDCNQAVDAAAPGFYEIVVRSLLEALEETYAAPPPLLDQLHEQHNLITTAPSVFQASLAFNHAISESCQQLGRNLGLLLDEFDEVYARLEDRALLNLRALKDKFQNRLVYLTATVRPLNESRTPGDNEFAELFAAGSLPLERLSPADARQFIEQQGGARFPPETLQSILRLAGGHFGLLTALTQAAQRDPHAAGLAGGPQARAECMKIWNQLRAEEQAALKSLVTNAQEGLNPHDRDQLQALGLLDDQGAFFSELFASFVRRQCAAPAQEASGVLVDEDAGEVWVDGIKITVLTDLEYRLMRLLYQRQDRLTTKDMIVEAVWGGQYFDKVDDARIEKLVSRLRAKIEPDPARPRYLHTQRGRGYRLSSRPVDSKLEGEGS
ncbi:MAG: winged helix-turn-helix transcriptional regulator [Chloroflexi bacterium]|nr:winged helix-turn-helix transcriptional regulator [Chloroflexota bacterium]